MNATEIPSGSQHNFYFPSSTLLNILGMVVRRCRHLLRFRSWFVDHPAASRQVSHPSCRHHRIHRHIHLCPYLHPCHPCLDRKQTVGRILFCWNSPLLNAKNQDRSSQIEQKVNNDFQLSRGATQCNTMQLVYFKFTTFKAILRANSRPPAESRRLGSDQANHDVFKLMARPLPANSTFKKPSNICYNYQTQVKTSFYFLTLSGRIFALEGPRLLEIQNCFSLCTMVSINA